MIFILTSNGLGLREKRLLTKQAESTFSQHMGDYGRDIGPRYFTSGFKEKNAIKMVSGPVMGALSLVLEGPDQLYSGVVGQKYHVPTGIAGRTRRDLGLALKDAVTLHPFKALGDVYRLITADIPLDAGDAVFGHTAA